MLGSQLEVVAVSKPAGQVVEQLVGYLDDLATRLADEVLVGVVGQVVDGSAVPEVDVVDNPQCLEGVERAVDRRLMDVRVRPLDGVGELVGGDVAGGVDERGHDRPPGGGDAAAIGPEEAEDAVEPGQVHRPARLAQAGQLRTGRISIQVAVRSVHMTMGFRDAPRRLVLPVLVAVGLLGAACGSSGGGGAASPADGRLQIVTTVAPITSIVAEVVGDSARVVGIVPEGTNSHTFEPAPSVAEVLSKADVMFVNGLKLEDPTLRLAEKNAKAGAKIVKLGDEVLPPSDYIYDFSFPESEGKPNPHLWTDPTYAKRYAEVVRDTMVQADPTHAEVYRTNEAAFALQVDGLDAAMRTAFATMTPDQRKLLTYHDAYAYFAKTYGWTVIGAIQVESFDEPSASEVAALIRQVRAEKVKAIFGSEVFPSPVLQQIGKEAGVAYVDVLRDDDLPGKPGQPEHSWVGLMRFDYLTMVKALGGDPTALEEFSVTEPTVDSAVYPQ